MKSKLVRYLAGLVLLAHTCATGLSSDVADADARLNRWLTAQTNFTSWRAEFVQTRILKALTQPLISQGRIWFVAPNLFRWELGIPAKSVALRTETDLIVLAPNLKRAERYPLAEMAKGPIKGLASLMDTGFPRDAAAFKKQFEMLGAAETNDVCIFRFAPRESAIRKLLPELSIGVSSLDSTLRTTSLQFADGSILRNDFTNSAINPHIDPALFVAPLDNQWKVTEPMKQP